MNVAHYIDTCAVIDTAMIILVAMASKVIVRGIVVGEDNARWKNVLLDDRHERVFLAILGYDGLDTALALYHSEYGCLGLGGFSDALSSRADSSFVDLNAVSLQLHVL